MRKTIALMISVIMLLGIMCVSVFAEMDFPNPWELEDFGQKNWTLYLNEESAPDVDGVVEEGEYALAIEDMAVANNAEDDRFFVVDFPSDLVVDLYMDYDGDYYYIAVVIDDPTPGVQGLHGADSRVTFKIGGDKEDLKHESMLEIKLLPESLSANGVDQVAYGLVDNVTTYEISIDKYEILDKYGYDELEQIYIRMTVADETPDSTENSALYNDLWFGFTTGDLREIYPAAASGIVTRYPHVIYFVNEAQETEAPETEAPETDAPETDAPETDAPATDAPETEAPTTNAPATNAPATDAPETETPANEGGCRSSVAAVAVALVATLGTCTAFISRKR